MRAILLALGFVLSIFSSDVVYAAEGEVINGVSFHIDTDDPVLKDWFSIKLKAFGYGRSVPKSCADVVVEARRMTATTSSGYIVMIRADFLSKDGNPLGRWASDPKHGLVKEDRPLRYSSFLERLTGESSFFMEVAEGAAMSVWSNSKNPSRRCGSG